MRQHKKRQIRKRVALVIVLTIILSLGGVASALAQLARVSGELVNVRSTPSTDGSIVGTLEKGHFVQVVTQKGEWYQVASEKYSGWIRTDLLEEAPNAPRLTVVKDSVNLRNGPGTSFTALGQVSNGFIMLMTGQQGDWYQGITPSGTLVYVRSDMVQVNGQTSSTPQVTTPAPPPVETPAPAESTANQAIRVVLNGSQLSFDVAPMVEKNRILVPLRVIFESAGATVDYDYNTKTVFATRGQDSITLPLNSTCPIVNGKLWTIDVPAKIVQERTLVPLRFAGESLGGTVAWDGDNSIASISIPEENVPEPDIPAPDQPETGNDNPEPVTPVTPPVTPVPQINQSLNMSLVRESSGIKVTMQADKVVKTEVTEANGKVTYVFSDINFSGLNLISEPLGDAGYLKASARNDGKTAIIEVSVPGGIRYETDALPGGKGQVFFIPNFITGIQRENYGSVGERLIINTLCPVEYSGSQKGNTVELTVSNTDQGMAESSYNYGNYLINSVAVSEIGSQNPSTKFLIQTKNVGRTSFAISGSEGTTLNVVLIDSAKIWPKGSTKGAVILDPGHGGYDGGAPGAISNEKDINLAIALKVRDILVKKGIACEMTRDADYYMGLEDRSDLANNVNAALFVSIHSNSASNTAATGTETYFYATLDEPDLYAQRVEREGLATAIHKNLISCLGTTNRGVKEENFSVLRRTDMPSALAEVAFMSNVGDEKLLNTASFQQKAAQAIADGIMSYMKN